MFSIGRIQQHKFTTSPMGWIDWWSYRYVRCSICELDPYFSVHVPAGQHFSARRSSIFGSSTPTCSTATSTINWIPPITKGQLQSGNRPHAIAIVDTYIITHLLFPRPTFVKHVLIPRSSSRSRRVPLVTSSRMKLSTSPRRPNRSARPLLVAFRSLPRLPSPRSFPPVS